MHIQTSRYCIYVGPYSHVGMAMLGHLSIGKRQILGRSGDGEFTMWMLDLNTASPDQYGQVLAASLEFACFRSHEAQSQHHGGSGALGKHGGRPQGPTLH